METDGIISVVPDTPAVYMPDTAYDIVHLNLILLVSTASIWPRIDLDALQQAPRRCGPCLAQPPAEGMTVESVDRSGPSGLLRLAASLTRSA